LSKPGDNPFDVNGLISVMDEAIKVIETNKGGNENLSKWAASLFDDSIIAGLPLTNAKKKFTKLSFAKSIEFYRQLIL
jgi:hypothetical protein